MSSVLEGVDLRTQMAGQNRLELLLFRLVSNQRFGINVFKVQEVIHCPPLTKIPNTHRVVRGIANMRGKTISVIDLSLAVGGPALPDAADCFVIITEYNRLIQGFLVGSVDRIVNMNWEAILPPPAGLTGASYMTAVTRIEEELVEIIDVEKVLQEVIGITGHVSADIIDKTIEKEHHHVLVADDSMVARRQVKQVLDELGVEYTLVKNGQEALDHLRKWADEAPNVSDRIKLVLSDIEMPKMDGYSLTAAIRKDPRLADLQIVLHSSLSGIFNESMVRKVGANRFLPKFDPDELAQIVQTFLKNEAVSDVSAVG